MSRLPTLPSMDSIHSEPPLRPDSPGSERRLSMPPTLTGEAGSPFLRLREDGEKKPFKPKNKHNLAAFGAKLTSTAASVANAGKYKQRESKEHLRDEPADGGSPGISPPPLSASTTLKNKMFKQSRNDLKALRIKTDLGLQSARASLSERSPMARGGSARELDRIAAIGLPASPAQAGEHVFAGASSLHHTHYPHISFRKRDSPAAVLSSSASNSTLASDGALYTFNSTAGSIGLTSIHSFKTLDEGLAFLESSWTLLTLRMQPLFKKEKTLRIPVEDVNILILMHFSAHKALGGSGADVLKKLDELLTAGMQTSSVVPVHPAPQDVANSWRLFHSDTLIALEAMFLPLQHEFDGIGQVLTTAKDAREYWRPEPASRGARRPPKLAVRRLILLAYRNVVLLPTLQHLNRKLADREAGVSGEHAAELMQCFATLSLLRTGDAKQELVDEALRLVTALDAV